MIRRGSWQIIVDSNWRVLVAHCPENRSQKLMIDNQNDLIMHSLATSHNGWL